MTTNTIRPAANKTTGEAAATTTAQGTSSASSASSGAVQSAGSSTAATSSSASSSRLPAAEVPGTPGVPPKRVRHRRQAFDEDDNQARHGGNDVNRNEAITTNANDVNDAGNEDDSSSGTNRMNPMGLFESETLISAQEELMSHMKRNDFVKRLGPLYLTFGESLTSQLPLGNSVVVLQPKAEGVWMQRTNDQVDIPLNFFQEPTLTLFIYTQVAFSSGEERADYKRLNIPMKLFINGALTCTINN